MLKWLKMINGFVWGIPAIVLILVVGSYLMIRSGFVQFRLFPVSIRAFLRQFQSQKANNGVSGYQALCTALAATVGTGNLAGVAGAIAIGGPGSVFWMWISALVGMGIKFSEAVLAVKFRQKDINGEYIGGPMYMIEKGLGSKWKFLASLYCFFGAVASFGVGNATQVNAIIGSVHSAVDSVGGHIPSVGNLIIAAVLSALIIGILSGGARRIGAFAERLIPFVSVAYILLCILVLILKAQMLPAALQMIIEGAFSPKAVTGGAIGSVLVVLRIGVSRGVFTNEAGMGTAAIAHAAADVRHPVEQGMMGIMEVFIDTILICTMTALVILCSGVPINYGEDMGIMLTVEAFSYVLGRWIAVPIAFSVGCLALGTVVGWGLYGVRCVQYLLGNAAVRYFILIQGVAVIISGVLGTGVVWLLAETVNGLMAIPNLIALALLSPELFVLVKEYEKLRLRISP